VDAPEANTLKERQQALLLGGQRLFGQDGWGPLEGD